MTEGHAIIVVGRISLSILLATVLFGMFTVGLDKSNSIVNNVSTEIVRSTAYKLDDLFAENEVGGTATVQLNNPTIYSLLNENSENIMSQTIRTKKVADATFTLVSGSSFTEAEAKAGTRRDPIYLLTQSALTSRFTLKKAERDYMYNVVVEVEVP